MTDRGNGMFQFKIGLEYVSGAELQIEITEDLYQRICESVGNNRMARYEYCFHFSTYMKERFPEVDCLIIQKIKEWKKDYYGISLPDNKLYLYHLISPWFEDI